MSRKFHILILSLTILYSCTTDSAYEREKHFSDSTEVSNINIEQKKIADDCEKKTNETTFKGLFNAYCPSDTSTSVPYSSFKKFPFDTMVTKKKDTVTYFFKVSNECCLKYFCNFTIHLDTLILSYNFCDNGYRCDCDCDYHLTYHIPTKRYKYKHIVLRTNQIVMSNTK